MSRLKEMVNNNVNEKLGVEIWIAKVRAKVIELQTGSLGPEIQFTHDPTGLGGQLSRRLLALRIGYMFDIRVTFPNEDFYPYENIFEPLSISLDNSASEKTGRLIELRGLRSRRFDFWEFWSNDEDRECVYRYLPPDCPLSPSIGQRVFEGILLEQFRLKAGASSELSAIRAMFPLPSKYIGVHFRRGDKSSETPYVPASHYRLKTQEAIAATGVCNVFLASDSASAVSDLQLADIGANVYFDPHELRRNNANHRFLMKNPSFSMRETLVAVNNISTLSLSEAIVGQDNAHFATLAAAAIALRHPDHQFGHLIRGDIELRRMSWKLYYAARKFVRDGVKKIWHKQTLKGVADSRNASRSGNGRARG